MSHSYSIDQSIAPTPFKFRKTGGSLSIIIPAVAASLLAIKEGATGKLAHTLTGEMVIIPDKTPAQPSYRLVDLLREARDHVDTRDLEIWENARPQGTEI